MVPGPAERGQWLTSATLAHTPPVGHHSCSPTTTHRGIVPATQFHDDRWRMHSKRPENSGWLIPWQPGRERKIGWICPAEKFAEFFITVFCSHFKSNRNDNALQFDDSFDIYMSKHTIAQVLVKQSWRIWVNTHIYIYSQGTDNITTKRVNKDHMHINSLLLGLLTPYGNTELGQNWLW